MVKISVVINTYNSARFVRETINTVLKQTFSDFELIIIDDGSQDETLELISTIQDSRIQVHAYANGGIAKSRNRGLSHASGEYIAYLDHDDLWHERKLEAQLAALALNPQATLAYSWLEIMDESGQFVRFGPQIKVSGQVYEKFLAKNLLYTASNPLMRRDALVSIGGFDETIYGADDWDLFLRLAEKYEFVVSPYYHIRYRVVRGSGSASVLKIERGCLQVIAKAFQTAPPELQPIKQAALGTVYQYLCFRTLEEMAGRSSGLAALNYLWKSYRNQSSLWGIEPLVKVVLKSSTAMIFPSDFARQISTTMTERFRKSRQQKIFQSAAQKTGGQ